MSAPLSASSSGFSLAETLIAVTILAFGLLSVAQLFAVSTASIRRARQVSTAAILAAQKVEELRTRPAGELRDEEGVEYVDRGGSVLLSTRPAGAYARRWSTRPHAADPDRLVVISVRVTPDAPAGVTAIGGTQRQAGEVFMVTVRER